MESNERTSTKMQESFTAWMKVAVAVAVIRSAPTHMKGREYAEKLAQMYQHLQYQWKTKYQKAEGELLHLKQQMIFKNPQQSTSVQLNSDMAESQPLFPTPPSSSHTVESSSTLPLPYDELNKNTQFLQSVINIQRTANKNPQGQMLDSVTSKTVHQCVRVVREMLLADRPLVSITNMKWSLQCIITLVDSGKFNQDTELNNQINGIIEDLVQKMMSTNGIDKESLTTKKNLEILLTCLSETQSFSLFETVLDHLMKAIEEFCNTLRQCCSGEESINVEQYENVHHIIAVLEVCLHSGKVLLTTPRGNYLSENIQQRLDSTLLHITEKYPLVAHSVWRIGAVLQMVIRPT
ncbi:meiosis-specific protein MEI4-like [Gigantopelta aegis]|uniref:meiosis-specific protein MEI4-like n=1 Tax=Gigantopelta aegis TaxID=1735272 RepID=UPI001B88D8A0|nr:meiosis-specific protein MEI4-like [Gigantopelta aegis]